MPQQEATLADLVELGDEIKECEQRQQREQHETRGRGDLLPQVDAQCLHAARFRRQWLIVRSCGHQRVR